MIVQIYRSIVVVQNRLIRREILTGTGDFLLSMLRCAFIFPSDQNLKSDLAALFVFLLYDDVISSEDGSEDISHQISLPNFIHQNLNLPIAAGVTDAISVHQVGNISFWALSLSAIKVCCGAIAQS